MRALSTVPGMTKGEGSASFHAGIPTARCSTRVLGGHRRVVQTKHLVAGAALNSDRRNYPEEIKGVLDPSNNGDLLSESL